MESNRKLVKLSDTDEIVADHDDDIRGLPMIDSDGEDLGAVDDLLLDPEDGKVRFVVVASGGFLGLGENKSFIPVDAITRVTDDEVRIDQSRERVAGAPVYDPDIVHDVDNNYYENVYGYYGFVPYWMPGYQYPALRV